jgi:hypothetical protein
MIQNENTFVFCVNVFIYLQFILWLSVSPPIVWNARMSGELLIGEDLDGTSHSLIEVVFKYMPGGLGKTTNTLQE